jgi:hypothetical protein
MSVDRIFAQLHDPATWPAPPERPLLPGDPARLRSVTLDELRAAALTEPLVPWVPLPREDEPG